MTLPPLPPIKDMPLVSWLTRLRSGYNSLANRVTAIDGEDGTIGSIQTGIIQRERFEHYDYPNDVYDDGTSSANKLTIATTSFKPKRLDTTIWVTGTIASSTGALGPDADGATAELHVNGDEVDSRKAFVGLNSYDLLPVLLTYTPNSTDVLEIEIKCWSTITGTRFRAPGTYFIIEEVA